MSDLIVKKWCSFCMSREATGTLTGYDPSLGPDPIELQSCTQCVERHFPGMLGQLSLF